MNKKPIQRRHQFEVLRQVCNFIPAFLVSRIARETGVDKKARTFSPWSHVVAMIYGQLTHVIGLNDLCDGLQLFSGPLSAIRAAVAPSRNTLSHANRERDAGMAEKLLWSVLAHLQAESPGFGQGRRRLPRFKRCLQAVDATVIRLVANCMDWAKHRRRKAATNYICGWICKVGCRVLPWSIRLPIMKTRALRNCAQALKPEKSPFLTRVF